MREMYQIHAEVFEYLDKYYYQKDTSQNFFTLRKSDGNGRLSRGYWFHGNDNYLAISFWSGTSWKNRTPNINFLIFPDGHTKLEIDTRDSKDKQYFILEYVLGQRRIKGLRDVRSNKYLKDYPGDDYMKSLRDFVETNGDKRKLDQAIKESRIKMGSSDNKLGFIDAKYFAYRYEEIKRRIRNEKLDTILLTEYELIGFEIENFLEIKNVSIQDLPERTKWIFITGENGCGKTSMLKALALGLVDRCKEHEQYIHKSDKHSKIALNILEVNEGEKYVQFTDKDSLTAIRNVQPIAFASYGPIRLTTTDKVTHKLDGRDSSTYSLFNYDGQLLDIEAEVKRWKVAEKDNFHEQLIANRLDTIKETLIESIPGLGNIEWSQRLNNKIVPTKYFEANDEGEVYSEEGVTFDKLPSGIRSLIAMIGDIIVRLFKAQMMSDDVKSLHGIVIIDEIDLHLHPRYQKVLVEALSSQFHNIQFIVSTHSPIPLLGAPRNSVFISVRRSYHEGIQAKKLDIDIANLLPNALLSSPIFGFEDLSSNLHTATTKFNTEDYYNDVIKNKEKREQLKSIANKLRGN